MYLKSELCFVNNGKKIFGELYLPSIHDDKKIHIVIISHGFNSNSKKMESYAKIIANNGFAVYTFDFIGGGNEIKSDGNLMDMSVLTEALDLDLILNEIRKLIFIDIDNITLMGLSQGGFVSTYVGCENVTKIKQMILFYPAYNIQDNSKKMLENSNDSKTKFQILDAFVSKKYGLDALTFNIYDMMKYFTKKVLILHGDKDDIVPISYSEKACKIFENAFLYKIKNGGHGFHATEVVIAMKEVLKFLKN